MNDLISFAFNLTLLPWSAYLRPWQLVTTSRPLATSSLAMPEPMSPMDKMPTDEPRCTGDMMVNGMRSKVDGVREVPLESARSGTKSTLAIRLSGCSSGKLWLPRRCETHTRIDTAIKRLSESRCKWTGEYEAGLRMPQDKQKGRANHISGG